MSDPAVLVATPAGDRCGLLARLRRFEANVIAVVSAEARLRSALSVSWPEVAVVRHGRRPDGRTTDLLDAVRAAGRRIPVVVACDGIGELPETRATVPALDGVLVGAFSRAQLEATLAVARRPRTPARPPEVVWQLDRQVSRLEAALRHPGARGIGAPLRGPELGRACQAWSLSPREQEVLPLAADGLAVFAIAAALRISETTVRSHLKSIYRKAGVAGRRALVQVLEPGEVALMR